MWNTKALSIIAVYELDKVKVFVHTDTQADTRSKK